MRRIEQVNEALRKELSLAIAREKPVEGAFVTINQVECTPDLKRAKIKITVLPEKMLGTALKELRAASGELAALARKRIKIGWLPFFDWEPDEGAMEANEMEKIFREIEKNSSS